MIMRKKAVITALLFVSVMFIRNVGATSLPAPEVHQQQTNWCWAASSQSVLNYYEQNVAQCTLAEELRVARLNAVPIAERPNWTLPNNTTCCTSGPPQNFLNACNQGNYLALVTSPPPPNTPVSVGNVRELLSNSGRNIASTLYGALSDASLRAITNNGQTVITSWRWDETPQPNPPRGHAMLIRGREVNENNIPMVLYMDPAPNVNNYATASYDWFSFAQQVQGVGHTWVNSLYVSQSHAAVPPQAMANGVTDFLTVRAGQSVNITASMNNTTYNADWWVILVMNGTGYYQNSAGGWVLIPANNVVLPRYQGTLTPFSNFTIWSGTPPVGTYRAYFGYDLTQDGIVNNPYYSSVVVTVQP